MLLITGLTRALLPGNWIPLFPDFSSAPHDGDHLLLRLAQLGLVLALAPVQRLREGAEKLRNRDSKVTTNFLKYRFARFGEQKVAWTRPRRPERARTRDSRNLAFVFSCRSVSV